MQRDELGQRVLELDALELGEPVPKLAPLRQFVVVEAGGLHVGVPGPRQRELSRKGERARDGHGEGPARRRGVRAGRGRGHVHGGDRLAVDRAQARRGRLGVPEEEQQALARQRPVQARSGCGGEVDLGEEGERLAEPVRPWRLRREVGRAADTRPAGGRGGVRQRQPHAEAGQRLDLRRPERQARILGQPQEVDGRRSPRGWRRGHRLGLEEAGLLAERVVDVAGEVETLQGRRGLHGAARQAAEHLLEEGAPVAGGVHVAEGSACARARECGRGRGR